jgi:ethanolamine utilization protein EutQ (cupin superfamily)
VESGHKPRTLALGYLTYGLSGRLHVRMDDGTESETGPGDAQLLPPGHDAWVVGDEPYVGLDFQGGHLYAKSPQ